MKEAKTVEIKVRIEPTSKVELQRFAALHRVDMSDVVRLSIAAYMNNNYQRPSPLPLPNAQGR